MKKTLLIAGLAAGLALSQTVQAQDVATADASVDGNPRTEATADPDNYHLAQVVGTDSTLSGAAPTPAAGKPGMPSVPYGLIGLLMMICVLVKRRNDPS